MKRFLFCIVMLFCMCMAMNAQRLKTYSGPYNDSRYMALDVPKATYTSLIPQHYYKYNFLST